MSLTTPIGLLDAILIRIIETNTPVKETVAKSRVKARWQAEPLYFHVEWFSLARATKKRIARKERKVK